MSPKRGIRLSLSTKFALLMITTMVLFAGSFAWISVGRFRSELEKQLLKRGESLGFQLAENSKYFSNIGDNDTLATYCNSLLEDKDVVFAQIVHTSGGIEVQATASREETITPEPAALVSAAQTVKERGAGGESFFDMYFPMRYPVERTKSATGREELVFGSTDPTEKMVIGYARLGVSLKSVEEESQRELKMVLGISAVYLVFGLIITFVVYRTLVEPVQRLTDAVQRFGHGEAPRKVETHTADELETLAHEFNKMTESIVERDRELAETNAQLLEANRVKAQFLANISHELKTPLNSIIGFSQLMLEGMEGELLESQREDLGIILSSGRHLLGLISQILDYAKIEAGREELKPERLNSAELVRECYQAFKPMTDEKGIELKLSLSATLPPITGDRTKMRQILLNLISNAVKFTDRGCVEVGAASTNGLLTLWVKDSGVGIEETEQKKIFEPFYQADSGVTRKYSGSGLGLTIAKSYVDMHGGRIWVESAPAKGAAFFVELPLNEPAA